VVFSVAVLGFAGGISFVHLGAPDLAGRNVVPRRRPASPAAGRVPGRSLRLRADHASESERCGQHDGEQQISSTVCHTIEIHQRHAVAQTT